MCVCVCVCVCVCAERERELCARASGIECAVMCVRGEWRWGALEEGVYRDLI